MDDIQTLLYIVIGLIYFLSRSFGKKKKPQNRPQQQSPEQQQQKTGKKPMTFEELLEEFTRDAQGQNKKEEVEEDFEEEVDLPKKQTSYKTIEEVDDEIAEPATRRFADDESRRIYEESVRGAKTYEKAGSLFDNQEKSRFAGYAKAEESKQNEIAKDVKAMLQDADDAKRAIILSEILNRKY